MSYNKCLKFQCCDRTIDIRRSYHKKINDFILFKFIHQQELMNDIISSSVHWSSSEFQKLLNFLVLPRFINGALIRLKSKNIIDLLENILIDINDDNFDKILNHFLIYYQKIAEEQVPWSLTDNKRYYVHKFHSIPVLVFELLFCSNNDDMESLIEFIESKRERYTQVKQLSQIITNLLIRKFEDKQQAFVFEQGMTHLQWWFSCNVNKKNSHLLRKFVCSIIGV